jgi:hypothetical protein
VASLCVGIDHHAAVILAAVPLFAFISLVVRRDNDGPGVKLVFLQDFVDLEVAVIREKIEGDVRSPSTLFCEGGEKPIHTGHEGVFAGEMVENQYISSFLRHPLHLGDHLLGVGDHRDNEGRNRMVEAVVAESHVLRVHLQEFYVAETVTFFLFPRFFKHLSCQIDADHLAIARIQGERDACADAYFDDSVTLTDTGVVYADLYSRGKEMRKYLVVHRRIPRIDILDLLLIHGLTLADKVFGVKEKLGTALWSLAPYGRSFSMREYPQRVRIFYQLF